MRSFLDERDLDLDDCGFRNLARPRGIETKSCQCLNTQIDPVLPPLHFAPTESYCEERTPTH
jgi:hypothetical protein